MAPVRRGGSGEDDAASNLTTMIEDAMVTTNTDSQLTSASPDPSLVTDTSLRTDSTPVQNQIALQPTSSVARPQASDLSRQLSVKSSGSYDAGLSQSAILTVLSNDENAANRPRTDSTASNEEGIGDGLLRRSSSKSTDRSFKSVQTAKSFKSVHSVPALGVHPLGTLRVHSHDPKKEAGSLSSECLVSGDVVIVTSMPKGALFGCDTMSLTIGKDRHFEGIRELPGGAHFIYGGSSSALSTRNGFWVMSKHRASDERGEVFVRRWDEYNEALEDEISVAEIRIQKENLLSIFDKLLPYTITATPTKRFRGQLSTSSATKNPKVHDLTGSMKWQRLTFAIKGAMLSRITGHDWNHWQVSSADDTKSMVVKRTDSVSKDGLDNKTDLAERLLDKDRVLTFVFPNAMRTYSQNVIGSARTEQAMDTSSHIKAVIEDRCTYEDSDEVIGELQFCYITGMLLGNIACMEQWAHVVKIVFKAFRLALDEPVFFRRIIETVHAQLMYDDEDVEGSIFDHDQYLIDDLKLILTIFKSRLNEQLLARGNELTDEQNSVGKSFEELESWLWKWGWDLRGNYVRSGKIQLEDGEYVDAELKDFEAEDERGEYAPVLVDLEEDGREKGLVRW